jgi:hypothetical protein
MRSKRFTASLFSSYDGLLIFGESPSARHGTRVAADRASGYGASCPLPRVPARVSCMIT